MSTELPPVLFAEFQQLLGAERAKVRAFTFEKQIEYLDARRRRRLRRAAAFLLLPCCAVAAFLAVIIGLAFAGGGGAAAPTPAPTPAPTQSPTFMPTPEPTGAPPMPTPAPIPCPADDAFSYPGSPWLGAQPNSIGSLDYNCDGQVEWFALCGPDGSENATHQGDGSYYQRFPGLQPADHGIATACGACPGGGRGVEQGYDCKQGFLAGGGGGSVNLASRKRFEPACPEDCEQGVTSHVLTGVPGSLPAAGDCAMRVTHCLSDIDGGDGEECCIIVAG